MNACIRINNDSFHGLSVLTVCNTCTVNIDKTILQTLLHAQGSRPITGVAPPPYEPPIHTTAMIIPSAEIIPPSSAPVEEQTNRLRVVIPYGVSEGGQMQVVTPQGFTIAVTVPYGKHSGDEIIVQYEANSAHPSYAYQQPQPKKQVCVK